MRIATFQATDAADAVAQVRTTLGAAAVVLNVRQLPVGGVARFWRKPRLEVVAGVLDAPAEPESQPVSVLAPVEPSGETFPVATAIQAAPFGFTRAGQPSAASVPQPDPWLGSNDWKSAVVLEKMGLLPLYAEQVLQEAEAGVSAGAPRSLPQELALIKAALRRFWRPPPPLEDHHPPRPHVFLGAAGSGKTTVLNKWLAQTVLMDNRPARVWRLDGRQANTAESLSVYCEILGVPITRSWPGVPAAATPGERWFVDLPGVDYQNAAALSEMRAQLEHLGRPQVHLVINAAYTVPLLLAQGRSFSILPVEDLICTHLDEESNWSKLWNLILGTNYSLRYLSAGQNIPGRFLRAGPDDLLPPLFRGF